MPKPRPRRRFHRTASEPFQPLRTLLHITLLQGLYYLAASLLILFTALVAGRPFSLDLIFSWRAVRADTTVGWTLGVVWLLCALVMVIAQVLIIARSKLVLDFTLTIHFLHLLVVSLFEHQLPTSWLWWALQGASVGVMGAASTWACRWRELRPMTFGVGLAEGGGGHGGGDGGGGEKIYVELCIRYCDVLVRFSVPVLGLHNT
ncbi:integral membrane protein S linking to the trans Golgi network-domain-containing protein [Geopyxis carbonaria]|nr:integral membrane protein S linking to the trans Golgi network-domain-containing protein [Geopyxis carbonaria]